ncbi:MAG: hypothetical protein C0191_04685 [Mucilaginibacter sp.]|nr:MAG: hypothetical protein C0191_04685 [Mucilaginibacter sp.]HEK22065.1 hypothetical protein [Bacteroidota bacterium]
MRSAEAFNALNETEQHSAVLDGQFLADREENGLIVQLLSLKNYYVERWYDPHANRILKHLAFNGTERLVPYIAHIKFSPPNL